LRNVIQLILDLWHMHASNKTQNNGKLNLVYFVNLQYRIQYIEELNFRKAKYSKLLIHFTFLSSFSVFNAEQPLVCEEHAITFPSLFIVKKLKSVSLSKYIFYIFDYLFIYLILIYFYNKSNLI